MTRLREATAGAPFTFVVGKGGTGKTTAAGALALEFADAGAPTHLISTDPAHSLRDLFGPDADATPEPRTCGSDLTLEEFDATGYADTWMERSMGHVVEIIDAGTYLDREDVTAFSRLALPGLDELMAVLRLVDLADEGRVVVVDTAPTGHTLRLLDAGDTHEGVARALRAMADKAGAVAGSLARRSVRLTGEQVIDELESYVTAYRKRVLGPAVFVVAARAEPVVVAETERLVQQLHRRGLRTVATVTTGVDPVGPRPRTARSTPAGSAIDLHAPWLARRTGCQALRAWRDGLTEGGPGTGGAAGPRRMAHEPNSRMGASVGGSVTDWLASRAPRLVLVAGKGGVGKSTCAAALALALSEDRDVLLCSTDPAGSLDDVFDAPFTTTRDGRAAPAQAGTHADEPGSSRLRVVQTDAQKELAALRDAYHADVVEALERLGVTGSAELDRRVVNALFDLAPPGIDEVAALTAMLDTAGAEDTIVIDSAPTGHFLRLVAMPALALDWTRQLMRIVVKYRLARGDDGAAGALLRLARHLRALQQRLHSAADAGVVIVTLDDAMVAAETSRLERTLGDLDVPVLALLVNRSIDAASAVDTSAETVIVAPETESPVGTHALREFIATWKIRS